MNFTDQEQCAISKMCSWSVKVGWIIFLHGLKWIVTFYLLFLFKELLKLLTNFIKNYEIKIEANASHYYFYVVFLLLLLFLA